MCVDSRTHRCAALRKADQPLQGTANAFAGMVHLGPPTVEFLAQPGKIRVVSATQMIMAGDDSPVNLEVLREEVEADGNWRARGQFPFQRRG